MKKQFTLISKPVKGYELIDSGDCQKLEKFGDVLISRPEPQAMWNKNLSNDDWNKNEAKFEISGKSSKWKTKNDFKEIWQIQINELKFNLRLSSFKHVGIFPEQIPNWQWLEETIKKRKEEVTVLNLFGYTGGATLACARAGAKVTHVDSSRTAISWARENAKLSGLRDKPIRWMLEDAKVFVKREIRRGNKYDGIIMDPPSFGRGVKGEVWKKERDFLDFFESSKKLLSPKPLLFLLNGYTLSYSPLTYVNNIYFLEKDFGGNIDYGELAIEESFGNRLMPAGIFARWRER